jgi:hypothetical protein
VPQFVIDPATGRTVDLPDSFGGYIGLPRYQPDPVYPPESAGADPTAYPGLPDPDQQPTISQTVMDSARFAAEKQRREALPEAVRNGTYDMDPVGGPNTPTVPMLAQRSGGAPSSHGSSMGQRAFITQSTGPLGTINQIGHDPLTGQPDLHGQYATQADLDGALHDQALGAPTPQPVDPNKPEQAGADLQRNGIKLQEQSVLESSAADQRAAGFEEREIARRNAETDHIRQETAKQAEQKQKRFEDIKQNVTKTTDTWAQYKVDPGRRWKNASTGQKIAAAISVAMSALGDALQHKSGPNLALEIINKSIEDDVNLQIQEREHLGQVASRARTSLDDYRQEFGDWQQARSAKLAEEYKRTADEIERLSAAARGDKAKASALAMVGDLRTRAGALEQGIATSAWSREMKLAEFAEQKRQAKEQASIAWSGQAQNDRHFNEQMKFNREELDATKNAKLAEFQAKSAAEQAKMLRELGVTDPNTGKVFVDKNGQPVLAPTETEAKEARATVRDSQTALSAIDELRKSAKALGPSVVKGKAADAFNTKLGLLQLQIKEAYKLGTLDNGSVAFLDKLTGGDPTKITTANIAAMIGVGNESGERVDARLKALGEGIERRALNQIGNPAGVTFRRAEEVQDSAANKAAEEVRKGTTTTAKAVEDVKPGWLTKNLQDLDSWLVPHTQQYKKDEAEAREGAGNSLRYPGFRAEKEPQLDTIVSLVQGGDTQAQKRLLEMVGDSKTPGLQDAAMTLIVAHAPELYPKALAELSTEKRAQRMAADAAAVRGGGPSIKLYPTTGSAPVTSSSTYVPPLVPKAALDAARRTSDPLKSYLDEGD